MTPCILNLCRRQRWVLATGSGLIYSEPVVQKSEWGARFGLHSVEKLKHDRRLAWSLYRLRHCSGNNFPV